MNLPNIKDARRRSKDKVNVYYDKYNIPLSIENIGKEKIPGGCPGLFSYVQYLSNQHIQQNICTDSC